MKTLWFEGAGWSDADISRATIGNRRIRTAFHLDDGRPVFLEVEGHVKGHVWLGEKKKKIAAPDYRAFIVFCHYITDETPEDDCNLHRLSVERKVDFPYTFEAILNFVNGLGASFEAIRVSPDLGGYRVYREGKDAKGVNRYCYGDEFQFDAGLTARREAVYKAIYEEEKAAGKTYPTFGLWVDQKDPAKLHLLKHFFNYNKHYIIRIDVGNTVEDWLGTMTETLLGRYGC